MRAPGSAKFLFIPDITSRRRGIALVVLIVLYVGSQLGSTLMATATADPNQRRLMLVLPLVFVVILYRYPAGLLVYWITTNLWTVGQQVLDQTHMGHHPWPTAKAPPTARAEAEADRPTASPSRRRAVRRRPSRRSPAWRRDASGARRPPPPRKKKKRSGRRR